MIPHACTSRLHHQLRFDGGTDLICEVGIWHGTIQRSTSSDNANTVVAQPAPAVGWGGVAREWGPKLVASADRPRASVTNQRIADLEHQLRELKDLIANLIKTSPVDAEFGDCLHCDARLGWDANAAHEADCAWQAAQIYAKTF